MDNDRLYLLGEIARVGEAIEVASNSGEPNCDLIDRLIDELTDLAEALDLVEEAMIDALNASLLANIDRPPVCFSKI